MNRNSVIRQVTLCRAPAGAAAPTGAGARPAQKGHRRTARGGQKLRLFLVPLLTWAVVTSGAASAAGPKAAKTGGGSGGNATTPGAVTTPYPTINNISVEWAISGDANNNGVVTMQYRVHGTTTWIDGMPLRRVPAGSNSRLS